jgi:alpha-beta hydrolase superfamily lysophospholipase
MESKNFIFKTDDGIEIFVYRWLPDKQDKIKAAIQLIHGMGDNAGRYAEFAENLAAEGFAVYAEDHRGHGRTAGPPEKFGHFADKKGWELVLGDLYKLNGIIKKENPGKNIFMLGHSMGSFLTRDYVMSYPEGIKGIVLSGTTGISALMGNIGMILSKLQIKSKGVRGKSPLMLSMTFGAYNKTFKPARTSADWISRDNKAIDKMLEEPYWVKDFSSSFFLDLTSGLKKISSFKNIRKTPNDLPIYFISGTRDALGNFTKSVKKVISDYKKAGIKDIQYKFYKDARHAILIEINKKEVYRDIINWLNNHL